MESVFYRLVLPLFRYGNGHFSVCAVPLDDAVCEREERVVSAYADVLSGVDFRAALAEDNVAGQNVFAAELLDAATLRVGVAPVSGSTLTFFMCHTSKSFLLRLDCFYLDDGKFLAVSALAFITLSAVLLDDYHFLPALVFQYLSRNACAFDKGRTKLGTFAFADHQNVLDFDCVAGVRARKTVHEKNVALFYCELFSLYFDCCFHCIKIIEKEQISTCSVCMQVYFSVSLKIAILKVIS